MHLKKARFAALCGVSRPSIGDSVKRGTLHCVDGLIDLSDPLNLSYLSRHNPELASRIANGEDIGDIVPSAIPGAGRGPASTRKEPAPKPPKKPRIDPVVMEARREEARRDEFEGGIEPSPPGGVDGLTPQEMAEVLRKQLYDAQKSKLAAQREAVNLDILHGSLGERAVFESFVMELWQSLQRNYIDVAPKQAALICKRLGMVGHELEVIEVLEGDIKKRQDNVAHEVRTVLEGKMIGARIAEPEEDE